MVVIVSLVSLLLETHSKLAFLALVRPIKLFRYGEKGESERERGGGREREGGRE